MNKEVEQAAIALDGWFKAPADGEYRFSIAGDDYTNLYFKQTAYDASSLESEEPTFVNDDKIAYRQNYSKWRRYFEEVETHIQNLEGEEDFVKNQISDWIELEEGKYYPMRGTLVEGRDQDHFAVAVEYKQDNTVAEPNPSATKEVQFLEL